MTQMTGMMERERAEAPLLPRSERPTVPTGRQMLFCVGAQKAGTTWLAENLSAHPECHFYPFDKEMHYFDVAYGKPSGMRGWKAKSIRKLLHSIETQDDATFARRVRRIQGELNLMKIYRAGHLGPRAWMYELSRNAGKARYLCDFTPDYSYSPPGAYKEMTEYVSPEGRRPKFIFILRDPVDRYWSFLRMMIRHRDIPQDRADKKLSEWMYHDLTQTDLSRRNHCDYRYTVGQLETHVPPEDVLFLFYETMFEQSVFDRVCSFLEIAPHTAQPDRRVHEGLSYPFPHKKWEKLRTALDDIYQFTFDRFGDRVPDHWRRTAYR
ncbi:MAG: sulfotransferase domain-containing protein [Pseudomonadota bacterium]